MEEQSGGIILKSAARSQKIFGEAQARAGREEKGVWGKRPEGVAEGDPTG